MTLVNLRGQPDTSQQSMSAALLLRAVSLLVAVGAVYGVRVADADLWGHIRYGQLFLALRNVKPADPFAYTSQGLSWHTHEYLAQIILYLAYDTLGAVGLILLKVLLGSVTIWLLYRSIRLYSDDARVWTIVFLLSSTLVGRYLLFRPQLFTYLSFALFTYLLHRYLVDNAADSEAKELPFAAGFLSRPWLLPLLIVPWANLHGGFVAGIGLIGLA